MLTRSRSDGGTGGALGIVLTAQAPPVNRNQWSEPPRPRPRHRACELVIVLALSVYACDRPPPEPESSGVTIRDSAGIRIVENHAPVWDSADFWIVDPEPEFVLGHGAPGDSAHLVWNIRQAGVLSDGRVAMLSPGGDRKVLVFEPSGRLSAAFGRAGRGPGEFYYPMRLQVLPGDTIVVWDQGFGPVYHFDPSGKILRERRIDLGAVHAATRTDNQRPGESVYQPLPDGSFLIEMHRPDWHPPEEPGVVYRSPRGYVRIDSTYSAHSFGWWRGRERLSVPDWSVPSQVPFPGGSVATVGGDPLAVYVTDGRDRYQVHQFSATGVLQRILRRTVDPVPVDDESLEGFMELAKTVNSHFDWPRWEREMRDRVSGRNHPFIIDLQVDSEGFLWVYDHGRDERSVFNPEGRWLGTVELPPGGIAWIGEDFILLVKADLETHLESVTGHRLNRRGRW